MQAKLLQLLFVFVFINHTYAGNEDSTATLFIEAKAYKGKTFFFNFSPALRPSLTLDSNGLGTIVIPIKTPSFVSFETSDSLIFNLIMAPGYALKYIVKNGLTTIKGIGSPPNNYLLHARALWSSAIHSKNQNPTDFIERINSVETTLNAFHRRFTDSVPLSATMSCIVKRSMEATLLLAKQNYLLTLKNKNNGSNLDNKFDLSDNTILLDTLLFNTQYVDFLNFLIIHFDQSVGFDLYYRHPEPNVYPVLLFSEIHKTSIYSERIKEYLLYANLATALSEFGIGPTLENIFEVYFKLYPASRYTSYLKKLLGKYQPLAPGTVAPDFQGKDVAGKTISLHDFKGKVVLVDVWATWCRPCIAELPYSHNIQKAFEKNKDFTVVYLSIDADRNDWKSYLAKNTWFTGVQLNNLGKEFEEVYKIKGIPRYILIDRRGLIINAFCDKPSSGKIEEEIRRVL